jgi:phage repressor protein C with HTH and peptisase S24 domain
MDTKCIALPRTIQTVAVQLSDTRRIVLRMDWRERALKRIAELGTTQDAIAEKLVMTRGGLGHWLKGRREPSYQDLLRLAGALQWTIDDLLSSNGAVLQTPRSVVESNTSDPETDFVGRVKGARFAAGSGELVFEAEEIDRSHGFRKDYLKRRGLRAERCKLFSVVGDSMVPTLMDGSLVLVNLADREIKQGEMYALITDNELRVKRLFKKDGFIEMRSDNQAMQHKYPPEIIVDGSAAVIGRIVWSAVDH